MWIKVCANTNPDDARLAADLGADAIGLVFAKSTRQVTPAQARTITQALPARVERIGVFDTQRADEIARAVDQASLTGAQLHGGLDLELVRRLHAAFGDRLTLTQTIHWDTAPGAPSPAVSLQHQLRQIRNEPGIDRVLVDSRAGAATGGTGIPFDWYGAVQILRAELDHLKLIVAGGLRAENVSAAIGTLSPWGVDVATGVEASPGKKDPKKLEAFIKKASLVSLPL